MGKINRKDFNKSLEINKQTGKSHIELVQHVRQINAFLLREIEKLQKDVKHLKSHFKSESLADNCESCNPSVITEPVIPENKA